jgi:hypothetical protein
MSRQFKRNGLRYVITDGEEIDFVRYDNKENILIALKNGAGFRGKLVRDNKRYDYAIERIEPGDLEQTWGDLPLKCLNQFDLI